MSKTSNFITSTKGYKASLILSGLVLLILFSAIVYQILNLQKSGYEVISHLDETRNINQLIVNLNETEEQFNNSNLSIQFLDSITSNNNLLLEKLDVSHFGYQEFISAHHQLYSSLEQHIALSSEKSSNPKEFKALFSKGRTQKGNLLKEHKEDLLGLSETFKKQNTTIPRFFIMATIIALIILIISLYKLYKIQKISTEKSSILDAILNNTNDIANFYEPVYSQENQVEDFTITYASKANITLTDISYEELLNAKISEVYPFLKPSGLFDQLVNAFVNQTYFEKLLEIPINEQIRYFKARYIPVKSGLQVMVTEFTDLYERKNELTEKNSELSLINAVFKEAEEIAKLGSYIWNINDNHINYSDNIYTILGYTKGEIDLTNDGIRAFVHQEDLQMYIDHTNLILEQQGSMEFIFRIISKDETIKYIYTQADYKDKKGEPLIVGIIQDVTLRVSNETRLQEKNIELERRNIELDSFNRVASHDLQEPLRKIQMFVSRIKESEFDNLNSRCQTYFSRIEDGATRMRSLINNLLAFSRIDSKDYAFEFTNLNEVFNDVLETFSEIIQEQNIIIEQDKLPKVYGIPFLLEQLFTNIIGNSIKYRAKDRETKIVIQKAKIHSQQIPQEFIKTHAYYHEIKIIDNGIGFHQDDNEKIFELFQRLHQKSDYSGTGIGLAICEKIVSKHHGFIYANSIEGKGSIFTIYLPSGKLKKLPKTSDF
tara:strand:- start:9439 stop:11586 length:2148 start_codon:yes stop_codon:yes gene_type:complete